MKILLLILFLLVFIVFLSCRVKICLTDNIKDDITGDVVFHIISLKESTDRRDHIKRVMDSAGMKYQFFDAYNKNEINENGSRLTKGEIALAMSHNELYKQLLASDKPYMLIGEDDCTIRSNFRHYLNIVLHNLPSDYDIIKLEYLEHYLTYKNVKYHPDVPVADDIPLVIQKISDKKFIGGTAAYIVSRKGAEDILKLNDPPMSESDLVMQKLINKMYIVKPPLAWQGDLERVIV
jgi:GR25 family glycosyltransferase involved in LPS biosynthesis